MDLQKKSFGSALKKLRIEKELTQSQFAELLGISTSYLKNLENSQRYPSHAMFERIIRYLNLSADTIIYPEKEPSDHSRDEMAHIWGLCNVKQQQIILALAETVLAMPELKGQEISPSSSEIQ